MSNQATSDEQAAALYQVGPYGIEALLGEGAAAFVYRAHRLNEPGAREGAPAGQDAPPIALKILKPAAVSQPNVLASFQYEARVLTRLDHRGILRVYETGMDHERVYMAMELADGVGFDGYLLAKKRLAELQAVDLAIQLAEALDYLHRHGYVHRDIKPANLMLTHEGRLLLFDFGTAIRISDGAPYELGLYGTPAYTAPEQIEANNKIDGRVDLYALGIMLYLMVTGRKPFYGGRSEVLDAHLHARPQPPSELARVSPGLEAIILKAIAKDPAARYQTGAEFAQALAAVELLPPLSKRSLRDLLFGWLRPKQTQ